MEGFFGQVAHAHLFVTNALLTHLKKEFDLFGQPAVLYDRPPSNFRRTDAMQQHEVSLSSGLLHAEPTWTLANTLALLPDSPHYLPTPPFYPRRSRRPLHNLHDRLQLALFPPSRPSRTPRLLDLLDSRRGLFTPSYRFGRL